MSNPKYVSRERILYFTASGFVELGPHKQVELSPQEYRVYFDEFEDGAVCLTRLDRKSGDIWIRDKLWNELDEALTDALEADIAAEQQEIVDSYDEHVWRTGS